jgi:hypothetical protein
VRRLVKHAAVGLGCTALAVSAAVAGLGSPAATGTAIAVPAPVASATRPTVDPAAVAAERAVREAAANRSAERKRLDAAVDQAVRRSAALSTGSEAVTAQQAEIVAERKARAAAAKQRRAEAKTRARAKAKAEAKAEARAEAARQKAKAARVEAEAAQAKADAAAAEKAREQRVAAQGYTSGTTDPREVARQILQNKFGYGADEFSCFNNIIIRESNWDIDATNASSGAYGIPQALPGSKMASVGSDWRTNPATQIIWAVGYMDDRYGSPCQAWSFKSANGWY